MSFNGFPNYAQIVHRSSCRLGPFANFGVTPYELDKDADFDGNGYIYQTDGFMNSGGAGSGAGISDSYDLRLVNASAQGMGWNFTYEARGKSATYDQYRGNRGIAAGITEYGGNFSGFSAYAYGQVAVGVILKRNGVSSQIGPNGQDILVINAATPDAFLDELTLPQMAYLCKPPVEEERQRWKDLVNKVKAANANQRSQVFYDEMGYMMNGTGQGGIADQEYVDPFMGFATYRDQYTITVGELMKPVPANENHIMQFNSASRGVVEIYKNHVTCNGKSIAKMFSHEFELSEDPENDVLTFELSGSPNSIVKTAAVNGNFRYWWDNQSMFHYISDYSNKETVPVAYSINLDGSFLGTLKVSLGTSSHRVNRVAIRGQPFTSFSDAQENALDSYYNTVQGATYGYSQDLGGEGTDITQENYLGKNCAEQAVRVWLSESAETTFSWENFPFPVLASSLFNRVVSITGSDPKRAWAFTNKNFVVTNVSINLAGKDGLGGGYYMCSISGKEIINRNGGEPASIGMV